MNMDKLDAAETSFKNLLKLSPDNISALVNLSRVEFHLGRAEEAAKYLQRAIRLKPDASLAWMYLVHRIISSKHYEQPEIVL
jgi:predicted Zn-dependent protease